MRNCAVFYFGLSVTNFLCLSSGHFCPDRCRIIAQKLRIFLSSSEPGGGTVKRFHEHKWILATCPLLPPSATSTMPEGLPDAFGRSLLWGSSRYCGGRGNGWKPTTQKLSVLMEGLQDPPVVICRATLPPAWDFPWLRWSSVLSDQPHVACWRSRINTKSTLRFYATCIPLLLCNSDASEVQSTAGIAIVSWLLQKRSEIKVQSALGWCLHLLTPWPTCMPWLQIANSILLSDQQAPT